MRQNLENGARYFQSNYQIITITGSCIFAFDWHKGRWSWTSRNFTQFRRFRRQQLLNEWR